MRRSWKQVAECGDNRAFAPEEVSQTIVPALEQDWRAEVIPRFVETFCGLPASLFKDQMESALEALRPVAGIGLGRAALDHAIQLAAKGESGPDLPQKAIANALTERAAKGARQVEEHFLRKSTEPRAQRVRARIEEAISNCGAAINGLSQKILKNDSGPSARVVKRQGLDDGVTH